MKKWLLILLSIFFIIVIFKYRFSNYSISYKIDNFNVKTVYRNKRLYFEITDNDKVYNFDIYEKRSFKKTMISKIDILEDEKTKCIYPTINNYKTYPLCYYDGVYMDYNLIDSSILDIYKEETVELQKPSKDFTYYNNLEKNEYVALWNYKGYKVMNGNYYNNVELFKNDKYDNSLAYIIDNTIYMANNDEEHEYTKLTSLNLETLKSEVIELKHNIDFDSYIVGNVKNKLYIFDNKFSILYEIDVKKKKTTIIGNNEKGYVKYEDGKFVTCSKSLYKVDKFKINNSNSNYTYSSDGMYKSFNENNILNIKINNNENKIIKEKDNAIYYQYKDNFYKYEPLNGSRIIFYNYELTFNSNNTIFVYNK